MWVRSNNLDVNGFGAITSAVILGTIGVLSFIVQPGLVQGFVTELNLSEAEANDLAFVEMIGVAIATYAAAIAGRVTSWRTLTAIALLTAVAGNLGSALLSEPNAFRAARFVTGLGEGAIIGLSFAFIGLTRKVERNLAIYLVLLLSYGAIGLWAMPAAFDAIGLNGIFIFWALLTALAAGTLPWLPHGANNRVETRPNAVSVGLPMLIVALVAVLLYNTAIGIAWANLFLIGMDIRPEEQSIANALLLSQFVAIFGAVVPVFLQVRLGRWLPLIAGVLGAAGSIALLLYKPSYLIFVLAVCGFNFMWNFFLPFLMGSVSDMSEREIMSIAVALQMTGLGFGPFIAARILGENGDFQTMMIVTVVLLLVSLVLLLFAEGHRRNRLSRST